MARREPTPWWLWPGAVLAVAAAIGIAIYIARTAPAPVSALPGTSTNLPIATSDATPSSAAMIQHPIDAATPQSATADTSPLPPLDASDAAVAQAFASMFGADGIGALLNPQHVIQRIVATIDALPRQKLAPDAMPVRGAQGAFVARQNAQRDEIDPRNFARYDAYTRVARSIDAKALVAWYVHFYPLFQQAYRELGYPDGYFNDRLVAVIDHLLATPDLAQPPGLTQPNVMFEYVDPTLESRSAGQKLLLRSGPENEAAIKAKLREIRTALTGQTLPHD